MHEREVAVGATHGPDEAERLGGVDGGQRRGDIGVASCDERGQIECFAEHRGLLDDLLYAGAQPGQSAGDGIADRGRNGRM